MSKSELAGRVDLTVNDDVDDTSSGSMSIFLRFVGVVFFFIVTCGGFVGLLFAVLILLGILSNDWQNTTCSGSSGGFGADQQICSSHELSLTGLQFCSAFAIGLGIVGIVGMVLLVRSTARAARRLELPGLSTVIGPLVPSTTPLEPASVVAVWAALDRLNHMDLPYSLTNIEQPDGTWLLTVRWRSESEKWRSILAAGKTEKGWSAEVTLHADGRYGFTEYSIPHTDGRPPKRRFIGRLLSPRKAKGFKSTGLLSLDHVYAPGNVVGEGAAAVASKTSPKITPSDAKIPVFHTLRSFGWLPRWNCSFIELFEY